MGQGTRGAGGPGPTLLQGRSAERWGANPRPPPTQVPRVRFTTEPEGKAQSTHPHPAFRDPRASGPDHHVGVGHTDAAPDGRRRDIRVGKRGQGTGPTAPTAFPPSGRWGSIERTCVGTGVEEDGPVVGTKTLPIHAHKRSTSTTTQHVYATPSGRTNLIVSLIVPPHPPPGPSLSVRPKHTWSLFINPPFKNKRNQWQACY